MTPMTHTQDPTPAIPIQRKASRAMTATLVALFAFLFVMLGFNLYLLLRGWFILPAIGAIGVALVAAAAYAWMRSRLNRYDLPPLNVATFRERISGGANQGRARDATRKEVHCGADHWKAPRG